MATKTVSTANGPVALVSAGGSWVAAVGVVKGTLNQSGAVTVTSSVTQLLGANDNRVSAIIYNNGSVTIYIGNSSVTASNGIPVPAATSFTDDASIGALYAITASSTADTRVAEVSAS